MGQSVSYQYAGELTAAKMSALGKAARPVGMYTGGVLTYAGGATATVSACAFEIADANGDQVSVVTDANESVGALSGKYIVWQWARGTSPETVTLAAVTTPADTDVVVGQVSGTSDVSYVSRTHPRTPAADFLVHPTTGMVVAVNAGYTVIGGVATKSSFQTMTIDAAPGTEGQSRYDLIYVNSSGVLSVSEGTASTSPSLPTAATGIPVASVLVAYGTTSITSAVITDLRSLGTPGAVDVTSAQTIAGVKTFSSSPVIPDAVNAYQAAAFGQIISKVMPSADTNLTGEDYTWGFGSMYGKRYWAKIGNLELRWGTVLFQSPVVHDAFTLRLTSSGGGTGVVGAGKAFTTACVTCMYTPYDPIAGTSYDWFGRVENLGATAKDSISSTVKGGTCPAGCGFTYLAIGY